jgi:hypothetical protein
MLFVDFFSLRQPKIKERQTDDGKHNSVCYWIFPSVFNTVYVKNGAKLGFLEGGGGRTDN